MSPFGYNNRHLLTHPHKIFKGIYHETKWFLQKLFRGYSDRDLWSLDITIINFIYPRLKAFLERRIKKEDIGFPACLIQESDHLLGEKWETRKQEWDTILEEMLEGFKIVVNEQDSFPAKREDREKVNRACEHLGKYLLYIWD